MIALFHAEPGNFLSLSTLIEKVPAECELLPFSSLTPDLIKEIRSHSKKGQLFSCDRQCQDAWILEKGRPKSSSMFDAKSPIGYTFILVAKK